ncbi:NAD(P)/FAD-dependent oxidoreductase [Streptomyces sp. NPDC051940]|uniref:FAD-dependent oxidoreductase n=1 Tax=Streptomyces sp. NPDC051940 TaxID=3155675 RepID=UPI0034132105
MTRIRTATVVGGGIAGPALAMALQKAGIEAVVHEAYEGTAEGVGGGLSIAPNGLNALALIDADEVVRAVGTPMRSIVVKSWNGKQLAEFAPPAGLPDQQLVWRSELYAALYDEAARRGVRIEHGKRLVDADETADGVTARFEDGTETTADILVGADGLRSTTRRLIDPAAPAPRYQGLLNFGGRFTGTGLASTGGKMAMSFGKRAFFGWQTEDDGTCVWFVNLPRREAMTLAECRAVDKEQWRRELIEAFTDDDSPAADVIKACPVEELLIVGPMEDLPRVPVWSRGRMVLIGDSAHATSPSSGQGASLAAESAVQLARCLRDLPYDQAFAAYEGLRRARCEKIIATAARTNSNKAAGPVARVVRDALMPVLMKSMAKPEKMAWQFGYRIDWDAQVEPVPANATGAAQSA